MSSVPITSLEQIKSSRSVRALPQSKLAFTGESGDEEKACLNAYAPVVDGVTQTRP